MNHTNIKTVCALKSFQDTRLNGLTLGLYVQNREILLDSKFFACCAGSGIFTLDSTTLSNCDLRWRYLAVQNLLATYQRHTGRDKIQFFAELTTPRAGVEFDLLAKLSDFCFAQDRFGMLLKKQSLSPNTTSNLIWKYAFAAIWRFGINCHVVNLNKTAAHSLLPKPQRNRKTLVIIENVETLDNPSHAFDFESVVSFAYNSCAHLIVEIVEKKATALQPTQNESYFARRIAAIKAKPQLSFLQPDCLSRLQSMMGDLR